MPEDDVKAKGGLYAWEIERADNEIKGEVRTLQGEVQRLNRELFPDVGLGLEDRMMAKIDERIAHKFNNFDQILTLKFFRVEEKTKENFEQSQAAIRANGEKVVDVAKDLAQQIKETAEQQRKDQKKNNWYIAVATGMLIVGNLWLTHVLK